MKSCKKILPWNVFLLFEFKHLWTMGFSCSNSSISITLKTFLLLLCKQGNVFDLFYQEWLRKKTSIKINLIYFLALIYTLIEKLLYYQEIFNNTYTQEKNRIVHAFGIWLIFPFYHNLLLFFTFLYLAYIYYFCHIMFYTLGLFKVKTESDFWMLPLLTYFFQKFV